MSASSREPTASVDRDKNAQHQLIFAARRYTSRYPLAPLRVYKLGQHRFTFYVEDSFYTSEQRIQEFNEEIRPATAWIELSSQRPESTPQEIAVDQLLAPPHDFEELHTLESLTNVVMWRHPHLKALKIQQNARDASHFHRTEGDPTRRNRSASSGP